MPLLSTSKIANLIIDRKAQTGSYTLLGADHYVVYLGTGGHTFTLPSAKAVGSGKVLIIKNGGSGTLNIALTGSDTTDAATTLDYPQSLIFISSGSTNWESIGSTSTATSVSISLVPSPATSVTSNGTLSLTATVSGSFNTSVTWKVDGITGGNSTVGTITGTGNTVTYNAPSALATHVITVTSVSDTTRVATCAVSVTSSTVSVSLTPSDPTAVGAAGTIQFSASVSGTSNQNVTWSVDGINGGNSTVGTINSSGLYTAPDPVPAAVIRTIKATSVAYGSINSSVRILTVIGKSVSTVNPSGDHSGATDTSNINSSLTAIGNGIVKLTAGNYYINPKAISSKNGIYLNSGNTLLMLPGAVLNCVTQSGSGNYNMVACGTDNCHVVGGSIVGDRVARNLPDYINGSGSDLEVGMGVTLANGSGSIVLGVNSSYNCCDGIYLTNSVTNWIVSDCIADNNRRQGISPVNATNGVIQYSTFSNTHGNDPAFGIDFEPNSGSVVSNILVNYCKILNNAGGGIAGGGSVTNGPTGNGTAVCNGITIQNCIVTGNGGSNYNKGGIAWDESDNITLQNNNISDNRGIGIEVYLSFTNSSIYGNTIQNNDSDGISLGGYRDPGNIDQNGNKECTGTVVSGNIVTGNGGTQINNVGGFAGTGATVGTNTTA